MMRMTRKFSSYINPLLKYDFDKNLLAYGICLLYRHTHNKINNKNIPLMKRITRTNRFITIEGSVFCDNSGNIL